MGCIQWNSIKPFLVSFFYISKAPGASISSGNPESDEDKSLNLSQKMTPQNIEVYLILCTPFHFADFNAKIALIFMWRERATLKANTKLRYHAKWLWIVFSTFHVIHAWWCFL